MGKKVVLALLLAVSLLCCRCVFDGIAEIYGKPSLQTETEIEIDTDTEEKTEAEIEVVEVEDRLDISDVPEYDNAAYVAVNDNEPFFSIATRQSNAAFEEYSELDDLGRCGVAFANVCTEIMPTEKRGDISSIHPSGWQKNKGWERCHLIGYQLSGENANARNLITGTGYLNRTGMLPFENMVSDYIKETDNHVLYRVTPIFEDSNLIASGVEIEAWSVEDNGDGICFNVYCYNVEPNGTIDYSNGDWTLNRNIEKAKNKKDVYWTDGGEVYHCTPDCPSLSRSKNIRSGSISESRKARACQRCY